MEGRHGMRIAAAVDVNPEHCQALASGPLCCQAHFGDGDGTPPITASTADDSYAVKESRREGRPGEAITKAATPAILSLPSTSLTEASISFQHCVQKAIIIVLRIRRGTPRQYGSTDWIKRVPKPPAQIGRAVQEPTVRREFLLLSPSAPAQAPVLRYG